MANLKASPVTIAGESYVLINSSEYIQRAVAGGQPTSSSNTDKLTYGYLMPYGGDQPPVAVTCTLDNGSTQVVGVEAGSTQPMDRYPYMSEIGATRCTFNVFSKYSAWVSVTTTIDGDTEVVTYQLGERTTNAAWMRIGYDYQATAIGRNGGGRRMIRCRTRPGRPPKTNTRPKG